MKSLNNLPENYREYYSVDMQNDKKMMFRINLIAILIGVAMVLAVGFFIPPSTLTGGAEPSSERLINICIKLVTLAVLSIAYIILHESVHGIAMKICGTKKVKYGFTGMYAFAGSDDYYDKIAYIFIALAPVILWGVVLAVICVFVPRSWFWVVYLIQIQNISGAAGDFFVTFKFSRFPKDILVRDSGTSMKVYALNDKVEEKTVE